MCLSVSTSPGVDRLGHKIPPSQTAFSVSSNFTFPGFFHLGSKASFYCPFIRQLSEGQGPVCSRNRKKGVYSFPGAAITNYHKLAGLKQHKFALAGVAQWIEYKTVTQRVVGSIPSQCTCLGCRPGPQ